MKVRKPMTLPELVKATGKPAGELEPLLQQMAVVGLLEYNWENLRRESSTSCRCSCPAAQSSST